MNNSLYNPLWMTQDYMIVVQAYFYQDFKDYITPENHAHNRIEIMEVVTGECQILFEDHLVKMKSGDLILIDADVQHRLKVTAPKHCRMLNIEFVMKPCEGEFYSVRNLCGAVDAVHTLLTSRVPYFFLKDPDETLSVYIQELIRQLNGLELSNTFTQQLLLSQILIKTASIHAAGQRRTPQNSNGYVMKVLEYMHSHYDQELSIALLAEQVIINERYLQQLFRTHLGTSVNAYLNDLRIEKAMQLLSYTDLDILKISEYVGINSQQYFSYLFRKKTGQTPREYRKKMIRLSV